MAGRKEVLSLENTHHSMRSTLQADIHTLFQSDGYRINDFRCRCTECSTSKPEYQNNFAIGFIRKGHFIYNVFRQSADAHNGCIIIDKPGYEHTVTHTSPRPDECTIFDFTAAFYEELGEKYSLSKSWFFRNKDIHSLLINTPAEADYLHQSILHALQSSAGKLEIDSLVFDMVDQVMENLTDMPLKPLSKSTRKNHLVTAERAKQYMSDHFTRDISLTEVAGNSYSSPFHFSRIFKEITSHTPHQYLLRIRLKHALTLIKSTELPVADIGFQSGFNSIDYFSAAFSKKYKSSPTRYRSSFQHI